MQAVVTSYAVVAISYEEASIQVRFGEEE